MKIFTAQQIRACDAYTIKASNIRSSELMERAAGKCAGWIKDNFSKDALFVVLCGTGNNGGDGLAITRLLNQRGYGVKAFVLNFGREMSEDCAANLQRLKAMEKDIVSIVQPDTFITDIPPHIVIVDAILGTGLSRPIEGWVAAFIQAINQLPNTKIAIDIPSGLTADLIPDADAAIFRADHTLSFQFYKRSFLHTEAGRYIGKVHLLDIGLDKTFINGTPTQYTIADAETIHGIYKPRDPFAHKGSYGHALIVAGSYGKIGAAVLSALAAIRSGAGMVTALIPRCGYTAMQSAVPEVMCLTSGEEDIEAIENWDKMDALGVGPGIGTESRQTVALTEFLDQYKKPLVVDADALNIIAKHPDLLAKLPKGSIITPHPKEFNRLFGDNTNSMIRLDHARIQAMRYNINIVMKGHHTVVVSTEGECMYNMTGNAGMATAGAGDVLTGILTGLLAQGYEPHDAAVLGVYLHGLAGDIAAKERSQESLIARDIIEYLGKAFQTLAG